MNTYYSTKRMPRDERGKSFFHKFLMAALIFALVVAFLPVQGAFAAPSITDAKENELEQSWSKKIDNVRAASLFYERVRVYPADFKDSTELARAHDLLNSYGVELRAAQALVFTHAGFNDKGKVLNENQADQSIKDVAARLQTMRSLLKRLNDLDGKYTLLPAGSVPATTAQ